MRVLLGMSGGVDSSAAAVILKNKGFDVVGLSINFFENSNINKFFNNDLKKNIEHASKICHILGIEHNIVDAAEEFKNKVIDFFSTEYLAGRTPFICLECNNKIKWPIMRKKAEQFNCDYIATGHYVNIKNLNSFYYIIKGRDEAKDQSFFLWGIPQEILKKTIFPIGDYTKYEVKEIIARYMPEISEKKESTGICFLKDPDYRPFLKSYIEQNNININKGAFTDDKGKVLGYHNGYPFYTIGQRRGLNLKTNKAVYVKDISLKSNIIILSDKKNLYVNKILVNEYSIVNKNDFDKEITIKIRYRKQATPGKVYFINENEALINLSDPLDSIAPGQSAVFYNKERVLGGGIIKSSFNS